MDLELMAALQGGGAPPGMAPPGAMGPGGPPMPMMQPPAPMGGTPADAALPVILAMQQQQQAQQAELHDQQGAELLSAMAAAVGQLPNPLGAAAASEGALPPAPDALGSVEESVDPAMAGAM